MFVIESRFGKDIANEIEKHVRQKKSRWTYLPEKLHVCKRNKSVHMDIKIRSWRYTNRYYGSGYVPDTSQYDDIVV